MCVCVCVHACIHVHVCVCVCVCACALACSNANHVCMCILCLHLAMLPCFQAIGVCFQNTSSVWGMQTMGQQTMHSPSPSPSQRRPERNTSCGMCLHIRIHSLPLVSHLFPQVLSPSVLYTFYCLLAAVGRSFPQVISPVFVHVLLSASSCGTFLPTGPLSRFCTRFIAC